MTRRTTPKWPILALAIMLGVIGLAIMALPFLLAGQADNAELHNRTTQIGGAFLGVGLMIYIIFKVKARQ
ncbi:MAG: hypothetical protein WBA51_00610 [Erythrobacter sp.]